MAGTYQDYYDAQIARYSDGTLAAFVAMLDHLAATDWQTEGAFLAAWVETQWAYWALDGRCETQEQRVRFDDIARSCGFVLIG